MKPILLILGFVVFLVLYSLGRRWGIHTPGYRLFPRPLLARILAGISGASLILALAAGTIWQIHGVYGTGTAGEQGECLVPSLPPPPFPQWEEDGTGSERFLVHLMALSRGLGFSTQVEHLEQFEVFWPRDKNKEYLRSFSAFDTDYRYGFHLMSVDDMGLRFSHDLRYKGFERSGSSSGSSRLKWRDSRDIAVETIDHWSSDGFSHHPLSLLPRRYGNRKEIVLVAQRISREDPLKKVGPSKFLEETRILESLSKPKATTGGNASNFPLGLVALAAHTGASMVLLLLVPILLSQVFIRRFSAFLCALLFSLFLAIGLDRYGLGVHRGRLEDREAPLVERSIALDSLTTSFFFRESARMAARKIYKDSSEPKALRERAYDIICQLTRD